MLVMVLRFDVLCVLLPCYILLWQYIQLVQLRAQTYSDQCTAQPNRTPPRYGAASTKYTRRSYSPSILSTHDAAARYVPPPRTTRPHEPPRSQNEHSSGNTCRGMFLQCTSRLTRNRQYHLPTKTKQKQIPRLSTRTENNR